MIEVAAAIIRRQDGRYLICKRDQGREYPGTWEFPGGKREPQDRDLKFALAREIWEELSVILDYEDLNCVLHTPHTQIGNVEISFFLATWYLRDPKLTVHDGAVWETADEIRARKDLINPLMLHALDQAELATHGM